MKNEKTNYTNTKTKQMKTIFIALSATLFLIACGGAADADIKAKLDELKAQRDALNGEIAKLEEQFAATDTTKKEKVKAVELLKVQIAPFMNFIDIQGKIDADENISLSAEMGGTVTKLNVKPGDEVSKGQILMETDNKIILQGIAELQNALDLANTLYTKQKNLWDQKIGTELQFLQAKNQKESLEKKMATLQEQLDMTRIKSPINGTVDAVDIKLGQMAAPGWPVIRVVNFDNLKVKGEVAESFAGKVKKGDMVQLFFPDITDSVITANVTFAAKVINPLTRTFTVEVKLNNNVHYHPNMVAVLKIIDYKNDKAMQVPVGVIQKTETENFIYTSENGAAKKVVVKVGRIYNGNAEILDGLKENDQVIVKGYQDLNEGEKLQAIN
jgi:RND family efflux transporter MFP subunit